MEQNLKQLINEENEIVCKIQKLKEELFKTVGDAKLTGVNSISENCSVVSVSAIAKSNILSAEYYVPKTQAKIILDAFKSVKTANDFSRKLNEIIENKSVKLSSCNHKINDDIIKILEDFANKS